MPSKKSVTKEVETPQLSQNKQSQLEEEETESGTTLKDYESWQEFFKGYKKKKSLDFRRGRIWA